MPQQPFQWGGNARRREDDFFRTKEASKSTRQTLNITTLNVEGLTANAEYAIQLMQNCDILCLQEHWLLNYEVEVVSKIFPDSNYIIKCVDDSHPDLPMQRRRGSAGTAIIWRKELDDAIEIIQDGSDRVAVVQVTTEEYQLLIINTYMPTMGCKNPEYGDTLDEVFELINKFGNNKILWTGDINADTLRNKNYSNDTELTKFLAEMKMEVPNAQSDMPTYHHFNGNSKSRLDMFITRRAELAFDKITNDNRNELNTGSHDALTATLRAKTVRKNKCTTGKLREPPKRIRWDKVDYLRYEDITNRRLKILHNSMEGLPLDVMAQQTNDILIESAMKSCPTEKKKKNKNRLWNPSMKPMVKKIKNMHFNIKNATMGTDKSREILAMKSAKKELRSAQRQLMAKRRRDTKVSIISACKQKDKREFFKLVKKQRSDTQVSGSIRFGDMEDNNSQTNSWANYFEKLATPSPNPLFDEEYEQHLEFMHLLLTRSRDNKTLQPMTTQELAKYISELKSGKSPDIYGVTAEHIKAAGPAMLDVLLNICNKAIETGALPLQFKTGILTPILKKGKNHKEPNSYRRITISSLVGKVLEKHMLKITSKKLSKTQSHMQFGFTEKCSPTLAAVLLTEVLAEAEDHSSPLLVTFMDSSKAFDVVDHRSMLNALHEQGVTGNLWNLFNSMYDEITSSVKWEGELSKSFRERQGIRQGGVSSPELYKCERNKGLKQLNKNPSMYIGSQNVGAVMVADDLAIISTNTSDMQLALNIAEHDAARERYVYNTEKTKAIMINNKEEARLTLNGKELGISRGEKHLGIMRNNRNTNEDTINARIQDARRASYSLMGAGLCGLNGSGAEVSIMLYTTYIIPTLLYGLEALVLSERELERLEIFHRRNLRHILHLPNSTASPAIYLLTGCAPVEAMLHIKTLGTFRNIADIEGKPSPVVFINSVISRQIAMKESSSSSWAVNVRKILHKYNLPSAFEVLKNPPKASVWKKLVKATVNNYWSSKLQLQMKEMNSTRHLWTATLSLGTIHESLRGDKNQHAVIQTTIATKLLVGRYPISNNHVAGKKLAKCPLCQEEEEDEKHFLLSCISLRDARMPYLIRLLDHRRESGLEIDPSELTSLIINPYKLDQPPQVKKLCKELIYRLHQRRSYLLQRCAHPPLLNPLEEPKKKRPTGAVRLQEAVTTD